MGNYFRCTVAAGILVLIAPTIFAQSKPPATAGSSTRALRQEPTSGSNQISDENGATLRRRGWRYTVQAGDSLDLQFELTPEFNQSVIVQPDGFITLRGLGEVSAAGQTLPELTATITKVYSGILRDPVISIAPKDFEKPYFVVGGQVGKPGKYDWRGDVTLTQAIAMAGGFTDAARHSQVLLFRRISNDWAEARVINVKQMLNAKNLHEDPVLQPGDMLYVPKSTISKIRPFIPVPSIGAYVNPY